MYVMALGSYSITRRKKLYSNSSSANTSSNIYPTGPRYIMKTVIVTHKLLAHLQTQDWLDPYLNMSEWIRDVYHGEMRIYVGANCDYAIDFEDEKYYTYFLMIFHNFI